MSLTLGYEVSTECSGVCQVETIGETDVVEDKGQDKNEVSVTRGVKVRNG